VWSARRSPAGGGVPMPMLTSVVHLLGWFSLYIRKSTIYNSTPFSPIFRFALLLFISRSMSLSKALEIQSVFNSMEKNV